MAVDHIFIDTNIFLNFYHYSDDDLEELKKLIVLLGNGDLVLYITEHLVNEFNRNRENKINEAINDFNKIKLTTKFPNICKSYDEHDDIKRILRDFHAKKDLLNDKLLKDIQEKELKADKIIESIFELSHLIKIDKNNVEKAKERFDLGNPPGKNGSYGDALNWELLLDGVKTGVFSKDIEKLYFITDDKDFISKIDGSKFNNFLYDEWLNKKEFPIKFFKKLSGFFQEKFPDIKLAEDLRKNVIISDFVNSWTFANTRRCLNILESINDFTDNELNQLIKASIENNQIYWIKDDPGITQRINNLIEGKRDKIDTDILSAFDEMYNKDREIDINDIPF